MTPVRVVRKRMRVCDPKDERVYARLPLPHCACGRTGHSLDERALASAYYADAIRAQEQAHKEEHGAFVVECQWFPCPELCAQAYARAPVPAPFLARAPPVFEQHACYEPDFGAWRTPFYTQPPAHRAFETQLRARMQTHDETLAHDHEHLQRLFPEHLLRDADVFGIWPREPLTKNQVRDAWLMGGHLLFPCIALTNDVTLDEFDPAHYRWMYDSRKSDALDSAERVARSDCSKNMIMNASCLGLVQAAAELYYVCLLKDGLYATVPQEVVNRVLVEPVYRACVRDEPFPLKRDEARHGACARELVRAVGRTCMTRATADGTTVVRIPYLPVWILQEGDACDPPAQPVAPEPGAPAPTSQQWDRACEIARREHPHLVHAEKTRDDATQPRKTPESAAQDTRVPASTPFAHARTPSRMSKDKQQRTLMDVGATPLQKLTREELIALGEKQLVVHQQELAQLKRQVQTEKDRERLSDLRHDVRECEARIERYADDPAHAYETYHPHDRGGAIIKSGAFKDSVRKPNGKSNGSNGTKRRTVVLDEDEEERTAEDISGGVAHGEFASDDESDASGQEDGDVHMTYARLLGEQHIVKQELDEAVGKLKLIHKWLASHDVTHKLWEQQKAREEKYETVKRRQQKELNRLQDAVTHVQGAANALDNSDEESDGNVSDLIDTESDEESEDGDADYDYSKDVSDDEDIGVCGGADEEHAMSDGDILDDTPKSKPSKHKKKEKPQPMGNPTPTARKKSKPVVAAPKLAWNDTYDIAIESTPQPVETVQESTPMECEQPPPVPEPVGYIDFSDEPIVVAATDESAPADAPAGFGGSWPAKTSKKDSASKKDKKSRSSSKKKEAPVVPTEEGASADADSASTKKKRVPVDPSTLTPEEQARRARRAESSKRARAAKKEAEAAAAAALAKDTDDATEAMTKEASKKKSVTRKRKLADDSDLEDEAPRKRETPVETPKPAEEDAPAKSKKKSRSKKPAVVLEPKSIFTDESTPEQEEQWIKLFEALVVRAWNASLERDLKLVETGEYADKCKAQRDVQSCYQANKNAIPFLKALDTTQATQAFESMCQWYAGEYQGDGFMVATTAPKDIPAMRWFIAAWYMTNGAAKYPKCVARNPAFNVTRPDPVVHVEPLADVADDELDDFLV